MNRYLVLGALLCACVPTPAFAQNSATSKIAPQKGWLSDLSAAKAKAQKSGKAMMVIFRCDP